LLADRVRGTMRIDLSHGWYGTMNPMRFLLASPLLLVFVAGDGAAMSIDPKAMARFDISYAKCEARFPEMRGARDEAYLSMRRVKLDDSTRAELAGVRKAAPYQSESKRIQQEDAKRTADPSSKLEAECKALWAETLHVRSLAH
jgi:hypothetical protein